MGMMGGPVVVASGLPQACHGGAGVDHESASGGNVVRYADARSIHSFSMRDRLPS